MKLYHWVTAMRSDLYEYQKKCLNELFEVYDTNGARVLELGGSPPFSVARQFIESGASHVSIINIRDDLKSSAVNSSIDFFNMDAGDLKFEENSFDVVFGCAVLEHFLHPKLIFEQCCKVVRPGGIVYLHGAPIWSSSVGHHLWITTSDGVEYKFNGNNPLNAYDHLLLDRKQITQKLSQKGIPNNHITEIVNFLYSDKRINRIMPFELINFADGCGLNLFDIRLGRWDYIDETVRIMFSELNGCNSLLADSIRLFLKK